jgi:ABC-type branched-subunit amino acid transport system ATPase component
VLGRRLRELCDRGVSTLLIDHDMGLVLSICDRVVVLEFGAVIADGPPEAVRATRRSSPPTWGRRPPRPRWSIPPRE